MPHPSCRLDIRKELPGTGAHHCAVILFRIAFLKVGVMGRDAVHVIAKPGTLPGTVIENEVHHQSVVAANTFDFLPTPQRLVHLAIVNDRESGIRR